MIDILQKRPGIVWISAVRATWCCAAGPKLVTNPLPVLAGLHQGARTALNLETTFIAASCHCRPNNISLALLAAGSDNCSCLTIESQFCSRVHSLLIQVSEKKEICHGKSEMFFDEAN